MSPKKSYNPRIAYAGDRDVAVKVLKFIISQNVNPQALLIPTPDKSTHAEDLIKLCDHLEDRFILRGFLFKESMGLSTLRSLDLDYIICVHFPYIIPRSVLEIPKIGVINLHPAYLPYNRGWHTPTWALLENTPYGATLHFMTEEVDAGDIIHQKRLEILPEDTADTLYKRAKELELKVFQEAWPMLLSGQPPRRAQNVGEGTFHKRDDLFSSGVQELKLEEVMHVKDLITRLRALTTNQIHEAAYFVLDGKRYRIQIRIIPEHDS